MSVSVYNSDFSRNRASFGAGMSTKIYGKNAYLKLRFVNNTFHSNQPFAGHNSRVQSTITVQNLADIEFDNNNM